MGFEPTNEHCVVGSCQPAYHKACKDVVSRSAPVGNFWLELSTPWGTTEEHIFERAKDLSKPHIYSAGVKASVECSFQINRLIKSTNISFHYILKDIFDA